MTGTHREASLQEIAEVLVCRDDFVICGHVSPDGDCLGSQLALADALAAMGKRVTAVFAERDAAVSGLDFLPGYGRIVPAADFTGEVGCFVGVDVPNRMRLGKEACALLDRAACSVTIDHHATDDPSCDLVHCEPDAPATCLLIWRLGALLGVERSAAFATCCYTGLMTDTGRFAFQNTGADAFAAASEMVGAGADPSACSLLFYQRRKPAYLKLVRCMVDHLILDERLGYAISWISAGDLAACGAVKADTEPLINELRSTDCVRIACILREQEGTVRGSLRSKGEIEVVSIARSHGGGGHEAAAGFTLHVPLAEAVEMIEAEIAAHLEAVK